MRQGTKKMKLARMSSWGTGAAVLALLTAALVTRKADTLAKPGDGRPNATTQPVSADDWKKVGQWLKDNHCDQRYQFIDDRLPQGRRLKAERLLINRVNQIQQIKDPDRKKAVIAELQAEDQIFAAQIAYRNNPSSETAANDVKQAVANLVDAQLAERNVQLNRLKAEVKRLQSEVDDLAEKKQDRINQIARGYLNQVQNRPHLPHTPKVGADGETESHNAEVKH